MVSKLSSLDFRLIPPSKDYAPRLAFIVPCIVEKIGDLSFYVNKQDDQIFFYPIDISRLNFRTGEMMKDEAIIYKKSFDLSKDLMIDIPFDTRLRIQLNGNVVKKIVWGVHNIEPFEYFLGEYPTNDIDLDEVFVKNYQELNSWLKDEGINYE